MGNGKGEGKLEEKKRCPFLKEPCIVEDCAVAIELIRSVAGLQKRYKACPVTALVQMISEINAKTPPPKIQIPSVLPILRG